jgi:hypothetical protein
MWLAPGNFLAKFSKLRLAAGVFMIFRYFKNFAPLTCGLLQTIIAVK